MRPQAIEVAPVSIVVPTIGRRQLLRCLASLDQCRPRASEIVLVDQSEGTVSEMVARVDIPGLRVVRSSGRGIALAVNEGVSAALNEIVLVTHDDCTVAPDWIGVGFRLLERDESQIVTGKAVPVGAPEAVATKKVDSTPQDFDASSYPWVLFPGNMAVRRSRLLEFGGFDNRFDLAGEPLDLAYRWLQAGRPLRYRPEMVVWHHGGRSPRELRRVYARYHRYRGQFYAKHLRRGDRRILRFLAAEAYWWLVSIPRRLRKIGSGRVDDRHGIERGLTAGFIRGLWMYRSERRPSQGSAGAAGD